ETLEFVRRYPDAERFYNQALRITPDSDSVRIRLAHLYEKWKGERDMAKKVLLDVAPRLDPQARFAALSFVIILMWHNPPDALDAARRGLDLLPLSQDAMFGAFQLIDLALVEARVGEMEAAIRDIDDLLSRPSYLSPGLLRIDPRWQPLYGEARFRKLAEMDAAQALGSRPQVPR